MLVPFSPPPGINSDDTTFSAEGQWADGSNVRFVHGKPQAIKGFTGSVYNACTGICRAGLVYFDPTTTSLWLVFGTTTRLEVVGAGSSAINNITPSGFTGGTNVAWSLDLYGNTLLGAPDGGTLYQWTGNIAAVATEITQAPNVINGGILVTDQRQVLAFACSEETSGTTNNMAIRGCDLEDITDWTTTTTNNAFEHILTGKGTIVRGFKIGPYVGVLTDNDLYLGQYIGDPSQTYRFDQVATNCGLVGRRALVIVNGVAYWMDRNLNVWAWAPGSQPQTIPCPILKDLQDNANRTPVGTAMVEIARTFAVHVNAYNEIWFFYCRGSATDPSHYVAYCIDESKAAGRPVWFRGALALTAIIDDPLVSSFWRASTTPVATTTLLGINSDGLAFFHEYGNTIPGGFSMTAHIQSADQYIDESRTRAMVRTVIPDFEDQAGDVSLTLFVRDRPQSSATTKGPHTLSTSTTKKDFRASGKVIAVKFSSTYSNGTASYWRLGKTLFDVVTLGER